MRAECRKRWRGEPVAGSAERAARALKRLRGRDGVATAVRSAGSAVPRQRRADFRRAWHFQPAGSVEIAQRSVYFAAPLVKFGNPGISGR
jgi:hypothetical protein